MNHTKVLTLSRIEAQVGLHLGHDLSITAMYVKGIVPRVARETPSKDDRGAIILGSNPIGSSDPPIETTAVR